MQLELYLFFKKNVSGKCVFISFTVTLVQQNEGWENKLSCFAFASAVQLMFTEIST